MGMQPGQLLDYSLMRPPAEEIVKLCLNFRFIEIEISLCYCKPLSVVIYYTAIIHLVYTCYHNLSTLSISVTSLLQPYWLSRWCLIIPTWFYFRDFALALPSISVSDLSMNGKYHLDPCYREMVLDVEISFGTR